MADLRTEGGARTTRTLMLMGCMPQLPCCDEPKEKDEYVHPVAVLGTSSASHASAVSSFERKLTAAPGLLGNFPLAGAGPAKEPLFSRASPAQLPPGTSEPLNGEPLAPASLPQAPLTQQLANGASGEIDGGKAERAWDICIRRVRPGQPVGLHVEQAGDFYVVKANAAEGLIKEWNDANPSLAVQPGDVLLEVNRAPANNPAALVSIREQRALSLRFHRYTRFMVSVRKAKAELLGLIVYITDEGTLQVSSVSGLLSTRNVTCRAGLEVLPGDTIERVNGAAAGPEQLVSQLSMPAERVDIDLRRPGG